MKNKVKIMLKLLSLRDRMAKSKLESFTVKYDDDYTSEWYLTDIDILIDMCDGNKQNSKNWSADLDACNRIWTLLNQIEGNKK